MIKIRILLLVLLIFGLTACPSPDDDISIQVDGISINAVSASNKLMITECDSIEWDDFIIEIQFYATPIALSTMHYGSSSVFATYEPFCRMENSISKVIISCNHAIGAVSGANLNSLFDLDVENCLWLNKESKEEAMNDLAVLQYQQSTSAYLKINTEITSPFSAKFYLEMELDDGTVLKDSTQTMTIF